MYKNKLTMKLSKVPNNDYFLKATIAAISHNRDHDHHSHHHNHHHHHHLNEDLDQTPPISPLRSPQLSSSTSSISSWGPSSASSSSQNSPLLPGADDGDSNGSSQCNSKEDRAAYNTKFARHHIETYRQNDRMRWNFDFDTNRPLDDSHHHHHQTVARYQWEPAV